ncbi:MAG: glycosyltransferase [Candidatus Electrothrix sp. AW5]|nr:glycosyltransferase [Candidatus Electrothrix gigas]
MQGSNISVLLAAYNGRTWLQEQIDSIFNQQNVNIKLFISVDTSSDGAESWVDQLVERESRVQALPHGQHFGNAASNFFRILRDVDFLDFDYIALADQDDIWHSDKLSRAIDMLKKTNSDGYSGNVNAFWPDGRQKLIDKAQPQAEWDYLFESAGPGCTFVMTQKLAMEVQNFIRTNQERMNSVWIHDWFIYAFARSHGYNWYIDKYPSMLYRQHENNQIGTNTGYKAFQHRMQFVLSGKALQQSSLIAELCGMENHSFVKQWQNHSRLGLLYLAFQANKCRRKRSEKIIFFFSCIALAIVGKGIRYRA